MLVTFFLFLVVSELILCKICDTKSEKVIQNCVDKKCINITTFTFIRLIILNIILNLNDNL